MRPCILLALLLAALPLAPLLADEPPLAESYLTQGRLAAGEAALTAHLQANPDDDQARFGLGTLQFLRGVERLGQALHRHGVTRRARNVPFLRLPVPDNPEPEPISYARLRAVFLTLATDLARAEATLARVDDRNVQLPLHFGRIRLDVNGDGRASDDEALWKLYAGVTRDVNLTAEQAEQFAIDFDYADVVWLRGYCHLLLSLDETILAHNWRELFERTGHVLFPKVESPYAAIAEGERIFAFQDTDVADLIAFIHLIDFPVDEPERMQAAHAHLLQVVRLSRENWTAIEQETDDRREWVPGPKQTGVIPGVRVAAPMVAGWREFLDETEAILEGRKLIPHPRIRDGRGINLKRWLLESPRFDLVLTVQGTDLVPYLEKGEISTPETWRGFQRTFRGQFFGFALWFN